MNIVFRSYLSISPFRKELNIVIVLFNNKGIYLSEWKRHDLLALMEIHKAMAKHKNKPKKAKWMEMANVLTKKGA